jgi:hypothetical protein
MNRTFILLLLLLSIGLSSCERRPEKVLSKGKMRDVLYDYHLAQAMMDVMPARPDGTHLNLIEAAFAKHGITQEEFDSSMVWYNRHNEDLQDIYKDLQEDLQAATEKATLASGSTQMASYISSGGDTLDIWPSRKNVMLRSRDILSLERFQIEADTSFQPTDQFILQGTASFLCPSQSARDYQLAIALSMTTTDGRVYSDAIQISRPEQFSLTASQAFDMPIRHISGFLFFQPRKGSEQDLCLVTNIKLIRMRRAKPKQTLPAAQPDSTAQPAATDTTGKAPQRIAPKEHLTPEQLRERQENRSGEQLQIRTAPAHRTPNSIGPSRRKINRQ